MDQNAFAALRFHGVPFRQAGAIAAVLLSVAARSVAQQVPALLELSPEVAAAGQDLVSRRATLVEERMGLHNAFDQHNERCSQIESDSPQVASCTSRRAELLAAMQAHIARSNDFNTAARAAIAFIGMLQDPGRVAEPIAAPIKNDLTNRRAYEYGRVINQFQVASSDRYAVSQSGDTYCNIFAWDVTRAMGVEIPHWVVRNDPRASSAIDGEGGWKVEKEDAEELSVNATMQWLSKHGGEQGWKPITDPDEAQRRANQGHPTIAIWENPKAQHGHIAIVRPGSPGDDRGPALAQAGSLILNATHLRTGFNKEDSRKSIQYWYHE